MDCDGERGLLEAMRNGERAGLASEATRNADLVEEHDRNIDLAAVEAIFVIGIVEISVGFFALVLQSPKP
ncbi:hypothetical protein TSUD_60370 [Trifolium subterraneum]|uniref:Uncharacterized protein n=1 Tax=Trifolium subterraneum TaxID=3900 RepID=A0A2Z6NS96_TRISU|nr:hypothetical protein TSUD_60370 [Trifolium subterraneum]